VISVALFVGSTFVPPLLRFWLWGLGLAIDLVTPLFTFPYQQRLPRLSNSKLPEHYGLLVIIVLGEAIVGAIRGVAAQEALTLLNGLRGALSMALVVGLWWVYFDFIARHSDFRQPRSNIWVALAWNYLHLPLVMSIAAVGAGALNVLEGEAIKANARWLLALAIGVALLVIGLIELTLRRTPDEPTDLRISVALKFGGALLALAIGSWGGGLGPTTLLLALFVPLLIQMLYGAYVWYHEPSASASLVADA
jgi:low temperature requirement protein LtrA